MYVKIEDTIDRAFGTVTPSTQAATDADSTPTCVVLEQGTALGYAPTCTNKATGLYNVQIACTAANGFDVGKQYSAYVVVVMGGVTTRRPIAAFTVMTRSTDDLSFPTVSGRSTDVSTGGEVGIDLANVGSPTTTLNLSGTTIKNTTDIATTLATIAGYVDTEVASIKTTVEALPTASAVATAILAATVEGTISVGGILRLMASLLGGSVADFTTGTLVFNSLDGTKIRATVVVDADGKTGRLSIAIGDLS